MKKQFLCVLIFFLYTSGFASAGSRGAGCSVWPWTKFLCVAGLMCCARGAAWGLDEDDGRDQKVDYDRVLLHHGKWRCVPKDSQATHIVVAGPLFENDVQDFSQTVFPVAFYTQVCPAAVCGFLAYSDEKRLPELGKSIAQVRTKLVEGEICAGDHVQKRAGIVFPSEHGGWDKHGNFGYPRAVSQDILERVARFAGIDLEVMYAKQNQTDVVLTVSQTGVVLSSVKKGF
ncbi:hypothetical protein EBQ93_04815 [bacterium]|nr:hypothetical protein [bacterium]